MDNTRSDATFSSNPNFQMGNPPQQKDTHCAQQHPLSAHRPIASFSQLASISSALNLHHDAVTVTEDNNALTEAAGVNAEPFWPGLFATQALASVNIGSPICSVGAGGPVPAAGTAPVGGPTPSTTAAPAGEKEVEAKKEESEECDDDMGFGFFTNLFCNLSSEKLNS
ncbi:LOW QUALITY PROTEIN: 60S acidic ribosomal protein P1-like [Lynx canadensis]|uniref:LOW QUALITY PROTEIN: 60S acidic ribosomal protein P1-like n=1 Tax=Lynx canadensis TaxID=61383 RepID=UPI0013C47D72|nr:LOW QUALITY PROTEIN: 60S acidic ribosomal protein P1-like [Lynx canadensis]